MPTVYEVPPDKLIERVAEYLKSLSNIIVPPSWLPFVKSGSHAERPISTPDFWYIRCASLLRKLYIKGPIGVSRLRRLYGGRKKGGERRPEHSRKAGGSIIRHALQQLEKAGLVESTPKGRVLTREGRSLLDRISGEILKELKLTNEE